MRVNLKKNVNKSNFLKSIIAINPNFFATMILSEPKVLWNQNLSFISLVVGAKLIQSNFRAFNGRRDSENCPQARTNCCMGSMIFIIRAECRCYLLVDKTKCC